MMKHIVLHAAFLLEPGLAWAGPAVSCPAIDDIKSYGGVYTTEDKHVWIGIAADGAIGEVRSFESALFYPSEHEALRGTLARCSYRLERGTLDMHFQPNNPPKVSIKESHWKRGEGPDSIVYYECKNSDPTLCSFTIES